MEHPLEYRMILLGAKGAGKTTYCVKFTSDHFVEEDAEFIHERYGGRKQISPDGKTFLVDLYDIMNSRNPPNMLLGNSSKEGKGDC
jgi:GTPase SAR1 family protein